MSYKSRVITAEGHEVYSDSVQAECDHALTLLYECPVCEHLWWRERYKRVIVNLVAFTVIAGGFWTVIFLWLF